MQRAGRTLALWALQLAILALPSAARGEPDNAAAAEALFQEGKAALDAGDTSRACVKLAESLRLEKAVGTLLNLARCHELEGKTATAWAEYRETADVATKAGQSERARGAADLAANLESRLSKLRIEVENPTPGLTVERNGGAAALGNAVPVDPGSHEIVASAPGRIAWRKTVVVRDHGDRVTVTIPALAKSAAAPAPTDKPDGKINGMRVAGFVLGGVGIVGLGVGATLGVMTLSEVSDARDDPSLCPNELCTPRGREALDSANTKGWVSTIAMGVGIAALATGTVLVIVSRSPPQAQGMKVVPWMGNSAAGLGASGAF